MVNESFTAAALGVNLRGSWGDHTAGEVVPQAAAARRIWTFRYLAFSFLVLGVACALNSLWLLGTLVAAVSVMSFVVIPREERYLERRFGAEYLDDKPQLGRWL